MNKYEIRCQTKESDPDSSEAHIGSENEAASEDGQNGQCLRINESIVNRTTQNFMQQKSLPSMTQMQNAHSALSLMK